jgi:hypothetical protein
MERFHCICETQPELFFDSFECLVCGRLAGYSYELSRVTGFDQTQESDVYHCSITRLLYRPCENFTRLHVCNGMVPVGKNKASDSLCLWCRYNETIPDLSIQNHLLLWSKMEGAKRRTLHTLTRVGLEFPNRHQDPKLGLGFRFITDRDAADHFQSSVPNCDPVYTGHKQGLITINLAEADDVARARARIGLDERYRTLIGHFRHEIGHYYWDRLVSPHPGRLASFRALFMDERIPYQAALDHHYQEGSPTDWSENHISAYASMHPWEDWAETWAHYMHMVDTLETAKAFGFHIKSPPLSASSHGEEEAEAFSIENLPLPQETPSWSVGWTDPNPSIEPMMIAWIQFTIGLNALNRSMGMQDAYPFVLTDKVKQKLAFIHQVIGACQFRLTSQEEMDFGSLPPGSSFRKW